MPDKPIHAVAIREPAELTLTVDTFSQGLLKYLDVLGLPSERVLVPVRERGVVLHNLQDVVENIATSLFLRSPPALGFDALLLGPAPLLIAGL